MNSPTNIRRLKAALCAFFLICIPMASHAQYGGNMQRSEVHFQIKPGDKRDARKRLLRSAEAIIMRSRQNCYNLNKPRFQELDCGFTNSYELQRLRGAEFKMDSVTRQEIVTKNPAIALFVYKPNDGSRWSIDVVLPDIEQFGPGRE